VMVATGAQAQEPSAPTGEAELVTIAAGAPHWIHYQGQLFNPNTNQPLANQAFNARFTLYNDRNGQSVAWRENKTITTNVDGLFNTQLGDTTALNLSIFDGRELYLGVAINNEEPRPLQPIVYVPYAIWSRNADSLGGFGERDFAKIIAYGFVDDDGGRESGRGFNSFRAVVGGATVYVIDFDDIDDYDYREYTTLVTPACARPVMVGTGSSEGDLVVDIWDQNGNRTQCHFQFMTLRRE
ncbi:MAG TPA: hypothetical protein VNK95_11470, partial [Caldilineaceae bacterium]|nr:hypothetical protein [Caldilineaceae bacterium]